jgi:hypothetical protein
MIKKTGIATIYATPWTINASYNQCIMQSKHYTINASNNQGIIKSKPAIFSFKS